MIAPADPLICLVTDRRAVSPGARTTRDELLGLERQIAEALQAGVTLVQVRERDLDASVLGALVVRLVEQAGGAVRIVVNDRADVAHACGAGGVHLRADGPPARVVRPLGPPGWIVGRSIHSTEEAGRSSDADYLLFGTVFPSATKGPDAPVAGLAALRAAVGATAVPVLAIGGITPARASACRVAGAAGLAAIGAFLPAGRTTGALGPGAAVRALRQAWEAASGS